MTQPHRTLTDVLLAAQRVGTLGQWPVDEVIAHARHFVDAIDPGAQSVIDLGSGAGVPGLVIAVDRPELSVTLVDRRASRMDALARAVSALGLEERTTVLTADAGVLGRDVRHAGMYDVVVCRGLGSPGYTARLARPFLKDGGSLIVSEPPDSDLSRWATEPVRRAGFERAAHHGVVAVLRLNAGIPSK